MKLKQGALVAILVVVIVGVGMSLLSHRAVDRERKAAEVSENCGMTMAELTQRALGKGTSILVLEHDGTGLAPGKQQWMQQQIAAFYAALKPSVEVTRISRHAFEPLAQRAPDVDAIVSFVGEPVVGEEGATRWEGLPPVVCFSFAGDDVPILMEAGVVTSAIVPRRAPISVDQGKKKDWFELLYEVVTADHLPE